MEASTIHSGGRVGGASGRQHLLLTKSVSIKLLQNALRLQKNLGAHNSLCCSNRLLHVGIARCHRGEFNAAGKHGYQRFKFQFRAKEERKTKRTWWSDARPGSDGGEGGGEEEEELGILEDFIESLWILKVFQSYGWGLPFIMVSWLLATGPKAFLMTLAIPLGQSAVTLAISRLWGKPKKRRPKAKEKRKKPSASPWAGRRSERSYVAEEEREAGGEGVSGKMGYQSRAESNGSNLVEGKRDGRTQSPSNPFGGWDELDESESVHHKPERVPGKAASPPQAQAQPVPGKGRQQQPQLQPRRRGATTTVNGKLARGRSRESSGTSLLLRLLVAAFPFLASWTKMF